MTLAELAGILAGRGIRLSLRLIVDAPRGALTSEVRSALIDHKPELLRRLVGAQSKPRGSWENLAGLRWGPAVDDKSPGIVIDRPNRIGRAERMTRIVAEAADDSYAVEEREAIESENDPPSPAVAQSKP